MAYVITLTGPSRCGKSEVIKLLNKISKEEEYEERFSPFFIPKYTTREFRKNELQAVRNHRESELDIKPVLGIDNTKQGVLKNDLEELRMRLFNRLGCDLVYEQYGNRYGVKLAEIYELLKKGYSPIIILNDIRTVEDIKTSLGNQCKALFIFREIPNMEKFRAEGSKRNESEDTIRFRFEKAEAIYRIYIENIHIFDKLILNVKNGPQSLEKILKQFLDVLCMEQKKFQ